MPKKNKHRNQQAQRAMVTSTSTARPPEDTVSAATSQQLAEVSTRSEEALVAEQVDTFTEEPHAVPPGLKPDEALKQAINAQRRFEAAREAAEDRKKRAEAKLAELEQARKELAQRDEAILAQELTFVQREEALRVREADLGSRERDAEVGFVALHQRTLVPYEARCAELRAQIDAQRAALHHERAEASAALQRELDEIAARAREAEAARSLASNVALAERDAQAREVCESLIDKARADVDRLRAECDTICGAQRQELDARDRELGAREAELRKEQRALHAEREMLDEDRADFTTRVERAGGQQLADAREQIEDLRREVAATKKTRDGYEARLRALESLERALGDKSPVSLLDELGSLREKCAGLQRELAERPGETLIARAQEDARLLKEAREQSYSQLQKIAGLKSRLGAQTVAAVELETLRAQKEAHESSAAVYRSEIHRLRQEYGELTEKDEARHPLRTLRELDERHTKATVKASLAEGVELKGFAEDLRLRLVNALEDRTLHYSPRDVRSFLGGMAMSRLMLLQGISGTGKTSLPTAVAKALGGDHEIVEVQAGWKDRQDLIGYYNAFHKHFYATNFLQALYRAGTPELADRVSIIVLDEINLSRVEQFFADFLSVLEKPPSDQLITLMDHGVADAPVLVQQGRLPLPSNVWFVGTANHDETTTAFADKTYDRAHVMELPRHSKNGAETPAVGRRGPVSRASLEGLFAKAKRDHQKEAERAWSWLSDEALTMLLDDRFGLSWGNRLERDVQQYVPVIVGAGGSVGEALDHLLATKVLRKLRDRYDVRADGLRELRDHIERQWITPGATGDARPARSLELIDRELRAKREVVPA